MSHGRDAGREGHHSDIVNDEPPSTGKGSSTVAQERKADAQLT